MSGPTFRSSESPEMESNDQSSFDQFLTFDGWLEDDDPILVAPDHPHSQSYAPLEIYDATNLTTSLREGPSRSNENGRVNRDVRERFAFKTKSDVEILDDGFKWRKYGKKMVKNSPNPRNYYKCAVAGCCVKKRVERDREDPSFVITTYEGFHNHQGPTS